MKHPINPVPGMNIEVKRRINVAVAAYAYEFENTSLVDDHTFDAMCAAIRPDVETGDQVHDQFFREKFHPATGQWVHEHPNIFGLKRIFDMIKKPIVTFRCRGVTDRGAYDFEVNADLLRPVHVRPPVIKHPCSRCGLDVTINPVHGGCYC
jgi:hypothetical protein